MQCKLLIGLLVAASITGCDSNKPVPFSRLTIDGVDGFNFGDSLGVVRDSLGSPPGLIFVSIYQGFNWPDSLAVLTTGQLEFSSPIEAFRLRYPYQELTPSGAGIGTTYEELIDLEGVPDTVVQEAFNVYCYGENLLQLGVFNDTVRTAFYGHTLPSGDNFSCR